MKLIEDLNNKLRKNLDDPKLKQKIKTKAKTLNQDIALIQDETKFLTRRKEKIEFELAAKKEALRRTIDDVGDMQIELGELKVSLEDMDHHSDVEEHHDSDHEEDLYHEKIYGHHGQEIRDTHGDHH